MASPEITNDGHVTFTPGDALVQKEDGPLFLPAKFTFSKESLEQCDVLASHPNVPAGDKELDLRSWLGRVGIEAHVFPDSIERQKGGLVADGSLQFLLRNQEGEYPVFEALAKQIKRGRIEVGRLLWFPEEAEPLTADQVAEELEHRLLLGDGFQILDDGTISQPLHRGTQYSNGVHLMSEEDWEQCFRHGRPELDRFQSKLSQVDPHLRQFDLRAIQVSLRDRLFAWLKRSVYVSGLGNDTVQHVAARFIGDRSVGMAEENLRHVELWMDQLQRVRAEDTRVGMHIYDQTPSTKTMVQSHGIPEGWVQSHLRRGSVLNQYLQEKSGAHDIHSILQSLGRHSRHSAVLAGVRGVEWIGHPQHQDEYALHLRHAVNTYGNPQQSKSFHEVTQSVAGSADRIAKLTKFEGHAYHRMNLFCETLPPTRELEEMGHRGVRAVFFSNLSGEPTEASPDVDISIPYDKMKQYSELSQRMQMGIYWVPSAERGGKIRKLRGHLFVDVAKLDDFERLKFVLGIYCSSAKGMSSAVTEDIQRAYAMLKKEHGEFAIATGASTGLMDDAMRAAPVSIGISTIINGQYPNMSADGLLILPQQELGDRQTALSEHISDAIVWKGGPGTAYEAALEGVFRKVGIVPFSPVPCADFMCEGDPYDPANGHQWHPLTQLARNYTQPFEVDGKRVLMCDESGNHVHVLTRSLEESVSILSAYNADPIAHWQRLNLSEKQIMTALRLGIENAREVQIKLPRHLRPAYEKFAPDLLRQNSELVW